MLPEAREKYQIITTRIIKCIVFKISILYVGNFKVLPAFKKLRDLCEYRNLEISGTSCRNTHAD